MPNHYLKHECRKFSQAEIERTACTAVAKTRENSNDEFKIVEWHIYLSL